MYKVITSIILMASVSLSFASGALINASYQVCFTPKGNCSSMIAKRINTAYNSVNVQVYCDISSDILASLIAAKRRGVDVFILLDKNNAMSKKSTSTALQNNGIKFLIHSKPNLADDNSIVIDGLSTITVSFDFSDKSQRNNAQSVIIIQDSSLASVYENNFLTRKKSSVEIEKFCQKSTKFKISRWTNNVVDNTEKVASSLWDSTKSLSEKAWNKSKGLVNGGSGKSDKSNN